MGLLCIPIIKEEWEHFGSGSCLECGNGCWRRQCSFLFNCWNVEHKYMEQENDEMLNCCSFLQVYFPSINSECIQDLFQLYTRQNLAEMRKGKNLHRLAELLFFFSGGKHLYGPFIRVPWTFLYRLPATTYYKEKLRSWKQVYDEQMVRSNKCRWKFNDLVNFRVFVSNSSMGSY